MSKATYLQDLTRAYIREYKAKWKRTNAPYRNKDEDRWLEVMNSTNRKTIRRCRRSAGKSNKLGVKRTPMGMVRNLNYRDAMHQICRTNRRILEKEAR